MSPVEYGQYSVFNSWLSIVTIIVTMQMYAGVYTQGLIKFDKERAVFSSSLQGLTTVLVLVWTLVYIAFRGFWNNLLSLTTVQMLAMLVMIWATAAFNFWAAEQRVILRYKTLVLVTLIVSLAKPLLGIFFVIKTEDKVTAMILSLMIVEFIGYIGLYYIQMKRGKKFFSAKFWKYALLFNLPLVPHYLSQTVLQSADRIMIRDMVGDSEAGIYSLAYSVSLIMTLFNTALSQTMSPWIYQKIKGSKIQDIHKIAYGALAVIAAANIIVMALGPEVVAVFAPKAYYDAIWVIPPVAMSVFFMFEYDLFAKFEFYFEKPHYIMLASVLGAGLNLILNYFFIRRFGYIAAGYTTLFCYVAYAVAHYIFMNKVCNKYMNRERPYNLKVLMPLSVGFVLVGFYFLFTYNHVVLRYCSLAAFFVMAFIFRKRITEIVGGILKTRKKI